MVAYCAIYGCLSSQRYNKDRSFFRFPHNKTRIRQWIKATDRPELANKTVEVLHKSYFICDLHFQASDRLKKKLKNNAIPTLNLPRQENVNPIKSTQTECVLLHQNSANEVSTQTDFVSVPSTSNADAITQTTLILSAATPRKRKLSGDLKTECGVPEEKEDPSGWQLTVNRRVTAPRTLTAVTVTMRGKIMFEDLDSEYTQQDLSDDGVYILDTGEELYLWQGKNIPERVKKVKADIVKEYISDDGLDRTVDTALVVSVKQGMEPKVFKKLFPSWEDDMWDNQASYEDIKNEVKAENTK